MADLNRRRSRKSKLVPRDCEDEMQEQPKSDSKPGIHFDIKIEVESCDDDFEVADQFKIEDDLFEAEENDINQLALSLTRKSAQLTQQVKKGTTSAEVEDSFEDDENDINQLALSLTRKSAQLTKEVKKEPNSALEDDDSFGDEENDINTLASALTASTKRKRVPNIKKDFYYLEDDDERDVAALASILGRNDAKKQKKEVAKSRKSVDNKGESSKHLDVHSIADDIEKSKSEELIIDDEENCAPATKKVKENTLVPNKFIENTVAYKPMRVHRFTSRVIQQLKVSEELILAEFDRISENIVDEADKILAIEMRNLWGRVAFKRHIETKQEKKLENALKDWRSLNCTTARNKEPPLMYKCYVCEKSWWHLFPFREHLNTHKEEDLKVEFEVIFYQSYIVAWFFHTMPRNFPIDGNCWRCNKDASYHILTNKSKWKKNYYVCGRCDQGFSKCTLMREHEMVCLKKNNPEFSNFSLMSCLICNYQVFDLKRLEDHKRVYHDVRSDIPTTVMIRNCTACSLPFAIHHYHVCPAKNPNFECTFCHKRFISRAVQYDHVMRSQPNFPCRICKAQLITQCMETEHIMLSHSKLFMTMYKCLNCTESVLFADVQAIKHHTIVWHHKQKFDRRRSYYEKVLLPREFVQKHLEDIPIARSSSDASKSTIDVNKPLSSRSRRLEEENDDDDDDDVVIINPTNIEIVEVDDDDDDYNVTKDDNKDKINNDDITTIGDDKITIDNANVTNDDDKVTNDVDLVGNNDDDQVTNDNGQVKNDDELLNNDNDQVTNDDKVENFDIVINDDDQLTIGADEVIIDGNDENESINDNDYDVQESNDGLIEKTVDISATVKKEVMSEDELNDFIEINLPNIKTEKDDSDDEYENILSKVLHTEKTKTLDFKRKINVATVSSIPETIINKTINKTYSKLPENANITIKNEDKHPCTVTNEKSIVKLEIEIPTSHRNVNKQPSQAIYNCSKCNFKGAHQRMKIHYETKHKKVESESKCNNFHCSKCQLTFKRMKQYCLHLKVHGYAPLSCPECVAAFPTYSALESHIKLRMGTMFVRQQYYVKNKPGCGSLVIKHVCRKCMKEIKAKEKFTHWESHLDVQDHVITSPIEVKIEPEDNTEEIQIEGISLGNCSNQGINDQGNNSGLGIDIVKEIMDRSDGSGPSNQMDEDDNFYVKMANKPLDEETLEKVTAALLTNRREADKECVVCERVFDRRNDTKRHIIEHMLSDAYLNKFENGGLKCQICQDTFQKSDAYKLHMRTHGGLPVYQCVLCGKTFSDSSNFTKHKKVHASDAPACRVCGRKFLAPQALERHMQMHETTGPFRCAYCPVVKYTEAGHHRHMKTAHQKKAKYRCKICKRSFNTVKERWDHEWLEHRERKMTADCPVCGQAYRKLNDLRRHAKEVHWMDFEVLKGILYRNKTDNPNEIKCERCSSIFSTYKDLGQHMVDQHAVEIIRCAICSARFITQAALDKHNLYKHNVVM